MPKDYRLETTPANQQRRRELARDDEWIRAFLGRAQVGHVASRWDDQPFITPTLFWYDPERHAIFFHSNITGRLRANLERYPRACFEASEMGQLLPSNAALEFSVQYASVIAFGTVQVLVGAEEQRHALNGLLRKYFPDLTPGQEYRPITDAELARTSAYALSIESWSGKENWPEQAGQSSDWPALDEKWLG